MFALSIPIPSGCIAPCYVIGAFLGRAWSHSLCLLQFQVWGYVGGLAQMHPDFALIGATAFTAAVCRSFAVVVAVAELTGSSRLMMPFCFASFVAVAVANLVAPSIFEAAANTKSLPVLHQPRSLMEGWGPVSDVMVTEVPLVPEHWGEDSAKVKELLSEVLAHQPAPMHFPVVLGGLDQEDRRSAPLLGYVPRALLEAALGQAQPPTGLERDDLGVAEQISGDTPVMDARLRLVRRPGEDLYVTEGGCFLGVVTFSALLDAAKAEEKRQRR
mmetsp:Transcript_9047/g.27682  ORF Transcript_9047/g.27682 Transcript_9047/m.27682 type:complete len:272 (-) Transcript_9047:30-845(-)